MTTIPQTVEPTTAIPVHSTFGRHLSFLEVLPRDDGKVRVRATELGRRSLNKFWTAWLRDLVLHKTDAKHVFAAEMRDGDVIVSWSKSSSGLTHAVLGLASQISPLTKIPLKRHIPRQASPHLREWRIVEPRGTTLDIDAIIESVRLPQGAVIRYNSCLKSIEVERVDCDLSTRDLALITEYHFAIACV